MVRRKRLRKSKSVYVFRYIIPSAAELLTCWSPVVWFETRILNWEVSSVIIRLCDPPHFRGTLAPRPLSRRSGIHIFPNAFLSYQHKALRIWVLICLKKSNLFRERDTPSFLRSAFHSNGEYILMSAVKTGISTFKAVLFNSIWSVSRQDGSTYDLTNTYFQVCMWRKTCSHTL